jgi:hypothetical protein
MVVASIMSAHQHGAATWARSHRVREKQRHAEIERQRNDKQTREAFLQTLAQRLANEFGIPLALARQRVQRMSITANR